MPVRPTWSNIPLKALSLEVFDWHSLRYWYNYVSPFDESIIQLFLYCVKFFTLPKSIDCLSDTFFYFIKAPVVTIFF